MNQLPSDGLDTFATLADVEMKKLDEQVRHGFNRVIREASKAGMINSSNAMVMVAAEAANSVPVRAHTLQNLMVRCLSDYGVPMSKATAEWATERLRTYLVHQCGSLRDLVRATAPFQGSLSYGAAASDAALSDIDNKAMLELRRIEAAFNLMVAAASRQGASDNNSGSQTNVFHGPVNVVQGPGSYSVAQLNLNADAKDKLVSALDAIASALSQQDAATLPFDADEVRELAIEGKTELEKPRPNSGKVRAFIAGVGSAIIEAPRLKASYDTLNGPPRSPASRFPRCAK